MALLWRHSSQHFVVALLAAELPASSFLFAHVVHVQLFKRVSPEGTRVAGPPFGPLVQSGPLHGSSFLSAHLVHVQFLKRVFPEGTRVAGPPFGPLVQSGPLHGGYRCCKQ